MKSSKFHGWGLYVFICYQIWQWSSRFFINDEDPMEKYIPANAGAAPVLHISGAVAKQGRSFAVCTGYFLPPKEGVIAQFDNPNIGSFGMEHHRDLRGSIRQSPLSDSARDLRDFQLILVWWVW